MPKKQPSAPDEPARPTGEIVLYQTEDGRTRVECRFVDETLWLSQALIAELFQKDVRTVNEHLQNLYEEREIEEQATIRKFRIVRREGPREVEREIEHYNLDAILAVGYRVRSERGTQFRRWATERLSEYLVKGFTMDDLRLKNPPVEGSGVPDYFDDLLERIRDIRASEKRMYLRVREIFSLAGDHDPGTDCRPCRPPPTEHGLDRLEGRRGAESGRDGGQELFDSGRNRRTEPHRDDVARFCGGSGATRSLRWKRRQSASGCSPWKTRQRSCPSDRSATGLDRRASGNRSHFR
jgi:hypothetical protein